MHRRLVVVGIGETNCHAKQSRRDLWAQGDFQSELPSISFFANALFFEENEKNANSPYTHLHYSL